MKKTIRLLILSIGIFVSCQKNDMEPSLTSEIEKLVNENIESENLAGVAIGVYHNGEKSHYFFGKKDLSTGEKIDELTIFEIGSITKTFTALLFANAVTQNQVSLNDTIDGFFPLNMQVPYKDGVHISFLNLLNHTSGLPSEPDNLPAEQPVANFDETALANYFNNLQLHNTPGTTYEYSNLGMGLVGYLLGRAAGTEYDDLLKETIFTPMGMQYTCCKAEDIPINNVAQGYYGMQRTDFYQWSNIFEAAGTIKSNLHDMMIYLKENIHPDSSSLKEALTLTQTRTFTVNEHFHMGLGWHITIDGNNNEIYWHNGGTRGFSSFIAFNNATKDGVVVLINSYSLKAQNIIGIETLNLLYKY